MACVAGHLGVSALEARHEACADVTPSRHFQATWLLAEGHSTGEVAAPTSLGRRWAGRPPERHDAVGPSAPGDLRRGNGTAAAVLKPGLLERLRARVRRPCAGRDFPARLRRRVSDGVSKPFLEALLEALLKALAEEAGAGRGRRIAPTLDNAGWHGEAGLEAPEGIRLVFQPPTPEVQPAETPWAPSTNPSPTGASRRSPSSTASSRQDARRSPTDAKRSSAKPAFIGGRKSPMRSDRTETVSGVSHPRGAVHCSEASPLNA